MSFSNKRKILLVISLFLTLVAATGFAEKKYKYSDENESNTATIKVKAGQNNVQPTIFEEGESEVCDIDGSKSIRLIKDFFKVYTFMSNCCDILEKYYDGKAQIGRVNLACHEDWDESTDQNDIYTRRVLCSMEEDGDLESRQDCLNDELNGNN